MKKLLLLLSLWYTGLSITAQSTQKKIITALDSFAYNRPQEKAYLQTDKSNYLAGETIWYKAYVTLGEKLTILSKVVYVDITDASGKIVEKHMLKLSNGLAKGGLIIKNEMPYGTYHLRCYTLWMLNFPEFITSKKITVLNYTTDKKNIQPTANTSTNIAVQFFPEGGNLVSGLKSVVAFKATDQYNNPVPVTGKIINSKNETVASFTTQHDGMGIFELLPASGESYKTIVSYNNIEKTLMLPAARQEGVILTVDNDNPNKIFVKAERSEKNKTQYNKLIITAQLNYQLAYLNQLNIDEGLDAVAINKKNLPPGIMTITVLTEDGTPIAERIVFVANHTINNDLLQGTLINTAKRKQNTFTIDTHDFEKFNGAISVTNADGDEGVNTTSIISDLLLSSDIKGHINNPAYYFKDKTTETLKHLDLVMLTNGWRRFKLDELLSNHLPPLQFGFETGLSISGKVLQSNGKSALKAGKINLIIKAEDSTNIISEARLDSNSNFIVDNIEYKKEATIYYQGTNTNKENAIVTVKVNDAYFDTLKKAAPYLTDIQHQNEKILAFNNQLIQAKFKSDSSFGKTLQTVTVKGKKRSVTDSLNAVYASDIFFDSDQTLVLDENAHYFDMWQFLQRMVPGININKTDTGMQVSFNRYSGLNFFSGDAGGNAVQFYLNEVPVSVDIIDALNPSDVGIVKVYKGVTGIALGADRGAIALYTLKGKSTRDWRQKGFDFFKKNGFTVSREFYEMDYSKLNPESSFSDVRTTLYWNPDIKIQDGKAVINFYNDDSCKKFKVVAEGIDSNGKLLHIEKLIQ
ncbi:hypothetical protein [Ferruginibacter profundus]